MEGENKDMDAALPGVREVFSGLKEASKVNRFECVMQPL
jgi:hypothetical protein